MKTSHKAVLTFAITAITAISSLSGGTHGPSIQAVLEETYAPAALMADTDLSQPVEFLKLEPKRSQTNPEAGKLYPVPQKYTILPAVDTLNQSDW